MLQYSRLYCFEVSIKENINIKLPQFLLLLLLLFFMRRHLLICNML